MTFKNSILLASFWALGTAKMLADSVNIQVTSGVNQPWAGADFWANPMEDWQVKDGLLSNTHSGGNRHVALLTAELNESHTSFEASTKLSHISLDAQSYVAWQLGIQGKFQDYRDSAIYGSGLLAGFDADGVLFIGSVRSEPQAALRDALKSSLTLKFAASPKDNEFTGVLSVLDQKGKLIASVESPIHTEWLRGLVSIGASSAGMPQQLPNQAPVRHFLPQKRGGTAKVSISEMSLHGDKVTAHPERHFGPIFWTQYSLQSNGKLKLLVQLAPLDLNQNPEVELHGFGKVRKAKIDAKSRTALFTLEGVDTSQQHAFTVKLGKATYSGEVRREPKTKEELVLAGLSCNDSTGFPHQPLVQHVGDHDPDLIAFLGDQIYEGIGGYDLEFGPIDGSYDDRAMLSYLRKFAMHGWSWRGLLKDRPSLTLPDDHDVFHGNLWGAGGKRADTSKGVYAEAQDQGGYKLSMPQVNAIHRTQTGNLPDPVDPTPCQSGISVYFTEWQYAGIDMAILGDRQFKSAPREFLPTSKIVNGWPQNHDKQRPALTNPRELDHPDAQLLGERQMKFLKRWSQRHESPFKLVLSQTPFMCLQTIPENAFSDGVVPGLKRPKVGEYPEKDIPKLDYDSNGWPQSKRDAAVQLLTQAKALHITGDQHLGSTGQYGVTAFNDAAWWISSPAIANLWPRRWFPHQGGGNRRPDAPKYTGEFEDGFGNRITLHAAANPTDIDREPSRLYDKAVGYSIIRLHRSSGHLTLENWPYWASPKAESNSPYPGWPIVIDPKTNQRIR